MNKRIRQYIGILCALVCYYIIHEGAHLFHALYHGVFKQINLMALGVQIDIYRDQLSDSQLGWFCLAGPLATFVSAWILILLRHRICTSSSAVFKACAWYTTIALLLLDPLYLSIAYRFVGGGDMNGIRLLIPETAAAIVFGILFIAHLFVLIKILLPTYKKAFNN